MSTNLRKLSHELEEVAKSQLFESDSRTADVLAQFREWIGKSAHLRSRTDDQFLIVFLRGCKFSLEKAKQKLDMYYTVRTHLPDILGSREAITERMLEILRFGSMLPLPQAEKSGPRMFIIRPGAYDATRFRIEDVMQIFMLINDLFFVEDDHLAVAGSLTIIDLKDVTLNHLTQMTPAAVKKMTMLMQEGSPIRQKGIHYVNTPPGFDKVFGLLKAFMNDKMRSRLYVHGSNMESLFKVIPKSLMPKEYGGDGDTIAEIVERWEKKVVANYEYLRDEVTKYGVDEKKRIGKQNNSESLFGVDGTFRQLEVD